MNLILQHWAGSVRPINLLSFASVAAYARRIGAEYKMLSGHAFDPRLTSPCQKLAMLKKNWDEFDVVAMLDADMIPRAGLEESIFDETGYGWHHVSAHGRVASHLPRLTTPFSPFWGGAIYRLPLELRCNLRAHYDYEEARQFNDRGNGEDEGIMHRLASLAHVPNEGAYFGYEWCWPSFDPSPEKAKIFHMRHHPEPKMVQYKTLRDAGLV